MKKQLVFAGSLVMALGLTACGKTKIELEPYVTISYEGYDTLGTASVEFDYKHFVRDYRDDLKLTGAGKKEVDDLEEAAEEMGLSDSTADMLAVYIKGELDKDSELSNGDEVSYVWDIDAEEVAKYFNCELVYADITDTVKDLTEATPYDPFEKISVSFTDTAPNGRIQIDNTSNDYGLSFIPDKSEGLSNGDTVTVSVKAYYDNDVVKYCLENYGALITETEKEYTVEGLASYLQSSSEISEDTLKKMQKQCEDIITGNAATWSAGTLLGAEYLGCYYLTPKGSSSTKNECTLVYRIDAHVNYEDKFETDTSYYYGVTFYNIMELADGTQSVDLSRYDKRAQYNGHLVGTGIMSWGSEVKVRFEGYATLDTMFNEIVTKKVENWNYENTVEDKAPSYPAAAEAPAAAE